MGASIRSCSSSRGTDSKLMLFCRQGVAEGEVWGLFLPCRKMTHSTPLSTARHKWVLSVREEFKSVLMIYKTTQHYIAALKRFSAFKTHWWSFRRRCISTPAWLSRVRGCWRSCCSAVCERSLAVVSSANAQCSYRHCSHAHTNTPFSFYTPTRVDRYSFLQY